MKYLVLTEDFCKAAIGYREGVNAFSFAQTNDGRFVTPEQAKEDLPGLFKDTDFETVDLELSNFIPDYTPPASNGKGIVIPEKYQWIFPCHVGGYTIELKEKDGVKYAEESCLGWSAFVREIRKPENRQYRSTILTVWNYGLYEAERIDL